MPVLVSLRQSPTYLYLKVYLICSLVSLFQAAPVSSRLAAARPARLLAPRGTRIVNARDATPRPSPAPASRVRLLLERWRQRAHDMAEINQLMKRDEHDLRTYPELEWDAAVRRSARLHPHETIFIARRSHRMSSEGTDDLHRFLGLPAGERVHPADVPLVALGGSGGGYRAMYGFAGFLASAKQTGLWNCLTWTAGVSGSCWTLAAYYTIAYHDAASLIRHYLATAKEVSHPMSVEALDTVARSSKGVYFLLAPLLRKAQGGRVGLGIMDLYATLTTSYQFLSREPRARLSRATFQLSKIWQRSGLDRALEPMPLFTAVRVAPHDSPGVRPHTDSSMSKGQPPKRALAQHQTSTASAIIERGQDNVRQSPIGAAEATDVLALADPRGFYQWFEVSPLEVGSSDVQAFIPTWAWGRAFVSGRSLHRMPEHSMSLILGQCTSAPAGPLTGYVAALLASLPKGTVMSRLLMLLNNFIRLKRWERRWGNPIRAGDEPNPFYGLNTRPESVAGADRGRASDGARSAVVGIGIDILHLPRLQQLVARQVSRSSKGAETGEDARLAALDRLARRVLCRSELLGWQALRDQLGADTTSDQAHDSLFRFLAVRWSAKEAAYKALYPIHVVSWKDLCVEKPLSAAVSATVSLSDEPLDLAAKESAGARSKKPQLRMSDEWLTARRSSVDGGGAPALHLAVSHDGDYVVANVLALRDAESRISAHEWEQTRLPPLPSSDDVRTSTASLAALDLASRHGDRADALPDPDPHGDATFDRGRDEASAPQAAWETSSRIRLMDSGMSNNLPNHVLAREERGADVIIAFDASSDVQKGSALQRIRNFADDCAIRLAIRPQVPGGRDGEGQSLGEDTSAHEIERRFRGKYAQRIDGWRHRDGGGAASTGQPGIETETTPPTSPPDIRFVYCPLLPNSAQPDFDPSTASFSNSYNLVWTPEQVETLIRTSSANLERHAIHTIREAIREAYEAKKARRLAGARRGEGE
ncbi:uncharacterized protein PFL1_02610 [Pseudozyma flocculosa PF-1]|uniref:Lysophospholipase n=2 Tax=Pseudozyma flocculosa TaxID=84751 RepID=A0A5C3F0M3_9BASI|nr:uncharacterized protein PFL1_02610 [Pseudozyma flocculosa PF-1]EPQ29938.1 hypothetical protein PFL1_02610 [Pseudozyma flocculosa PF-1]SPO37247.1 related to phospholipase A2, cytosolic [Pseudozyma flocculosa]